MFGLLLKLLIPAVSLVYPVYASYKALRLNNTEGLVQLLMYWVVISAFITIESWFGFLFTWLPLYGFVKLGFMIWLVLPQTQGSSYVYFTYIEPTLSSHEKEIEAVVARTQEQIKTKSVEIGHCFSHYVKQFLVTLAFDTVRTGIDKEPQDKSVHVARDTSDSGLNPTCKPNNDTTVKVWFFFVIFAGMF
ncbi:TB2/DP1, HVA22 family-domain-containing protein [Lipomyces japonicus]|uniref:TB2/DP1, HVA22 family-domain-containing protein n=1 Tax=Lipomyces japonicus TaxID=56871 RepID=UPI0034CDBE7E